MNNCNNNENDFDKYERLNLLANIFQILDLTLNLSQSSNDDIMKKLLNQDKVLDEQTNKYLKTIIKNQEKIIKILENMEH